MNLVTVFLIFCGIPHPPFPVIIVSKKVEGIWACPQLKETKRRGFGFVVAFDNSIRCLGGAGVSDELLRPNRSLSLQT